MVSLIKICKRFGGKPVLADFNLEVKPGETVCICGPSGCGKTTVLEIIAGILKPDGGKRVVGTKSIGYAFQDDCLIPWKTAEENMGFALSSIFPPHRAREQSTAWLKTMGLGEAVNKKPTELSGGMKRRLNLARSFAVEPSLLLLDEPFAFQDSEQIEVIKREITRAKSSRAATVILVSHEPAQFDGLEGKLVEVPVL